MQPVDQIHLQSSIVMLNSRNAIFLASMFNTCFFLSFLASVKKLFPYTSVSNGDELVSCDYIII